MSIPQTLGRYTVIATCGDGGMAQVYEAHDPDLNRKVAVKTIRLEHLSEQYAEEFETRFRIESQAAARLQHPHIIATFDAGRDHGLAYLVMEFVSGRNLKELLDAGPPPTVASSVAMVRQLLSALQYAHSHDVIHRDVKLANVMVDEYEQIKLGDFGVARIVNSGDPTRTGGSVVGTLRYMSPEQIKGESVDRRTDLFSAGVVLYQLVCGVHPFDGRNDFEITQRIVNEHPVAPSKRNAMVSRALDQVVSKALTKNRASRFSSAQEFFDALGSLNLAPRRVARDSPPIVDESRTVLKAPDRRFAVDPDNESKRGDSGPPWHVDSAVSQEVELLFWKEIKDSTEAADFHDYLAKFPEGVYGSIARRKLRRLAGDTEGSSSSIRKQDDAEAQRFLPALQGEGDARREEVPANSAGGRQPQEALSLERSGSIKRGGEGRHAEKRRPLDPEQTRRVNAEQATALPRETQPLHAVGKLPTALQVIDDDGAWEQVPVQNGGMRTGLIAAALASLFAIGATAWLLRSTEPPVSPGDAGPRLESPESTPASWVDAQVVPARSGPALTTDSPSPAAISTSAAHAAVEERRAAEAPSRMPEPVPTKTASEVVQPAGKGSDDVGEAVQPETPQLVAPSRPDAAQRQAVEGTERAEEERSAAERDRRAAEARNARRAEEDRQVAERSRRAEQKRMAAERVRKAEEDRLAATRIRSAEDARGAAEQAGQAEAERLTAQRVRRAEVERLLAERKRQADDERDAAERVRVMEEQRVAAELERKAQLARDAKSAEAERTKTQRMRTENEEKASRRKVVPIW